MAERYTNSQSRYLEMLLLDASLEIYGALQRADYLSLNEQSLGVLNAETTSAQDLPEHDIQRRLAWLMAEAQRRRGADPREADLGLAQTEIDVVAHLDMADRLRKLVPGAHVVGEEATTGEWDAALEPGVRYLWVLDAIDGSGLQDTVGFGYAATAILYRRRTSGDYTPVLMTTVTANSSMLGWISPGRVAAAHLSTADGGTARPLMMDLLGPLNDVEVVLQERRRFVACVAAQEKHRQLVLPLFSSGWTLMTLGGAPAMPGLLLQKLSALIIPSWQTRHDAAPLLALASQMGLFFRLIETGERLSDADVRGFFSGVERPGLSSQANPLYRPIPPMVVARSDEIALELLADFQAQWVEVQAARNFRAASSGTDDPEPIVQLIRDDKTTVNSGEQ